MSQREALSHPQQSRRRSALEKDLDTADIVREAIYRQQLLFASEFATNPPNAELVSEARQALRSVDTFDSHAQSGHPARLQVHRRAPKLLPWESPMAANLVPAAQYVRMSTDQQRYSFANQREAIARFAAAHAFKVVKSYEDPAKSGVVLEHRDGLKNLLIDVVGGRAQFKAILVYDVSRWGRFQDTDEAAHYEFLCKDAGAPVYYCAEIFKNDGALSSTLLKAVKRSMAGEYSRELSVKVYEGQKRNVLQGFRAGGPPGYGLRRLAVSRDGKRTRILGKGEVKPFLDDRVKLVPGPKGEITVVREIYSAFIRGRGRRGFEEIARELNRRGTKSTAGFHWTAFKVREVLRNPKYVGTLVWSRNTQRMCTASGPQPKSKWITVHGAFEPIIDPHAFDRVQSLLPKRRGNRISDKELLWTLRSLLSVHGFLSVDLMRTKARYSVQTYLRRLGTMREICLKLNLRYEAALLAKRSTLNPIINVRSSIMLRLAEMFPTELRVVPQKIGTGTSQLVLDGKQELFVWTARHYRSSKGRTGWNLLKGGRAQNAPVLLALMKPDNQEYQSLYLFPEFTFTQSSLRFSADHKILALGKRVVCMSDVCWMAREARNPNGRASTAKR